MHENGLTGTFVGSTPGDFEDGFTINSSGQPIPTPSSSPTPTPSPSPTSQSIILVSNDSTIVQGSANSNFGLNSKLYVDNSPVKDFLLKFPVSGINGRTVINAKLQLFNIDKSAKGGDFYLVADNNWSEGSVTWNTAPAITGGMIASLGNVNGISPRPLMYQIDVTSAIVADGDVSFRIKSTSSNGADYYSKQGPADKIPTLIITIAE